MRLVVVGVRTAATAAAAAAAAVVVVVVVVVVVLVVVAAAVSLSHYDDARLTPYLRLCYLYSG